MLFGCLILFVFMEAPDSPAAQGGCAGKKHNPRPKAILLHIRVSRNRRSAAAERQGHMGSHLHRILKSLLQLQLVLRLTLP